MRCENYNSTRGMTYAQAIEKALTAKEVENKIWKENAARWGVRKAVPPYLGSGRGRGPSDLKRKIPYTSTVVGLDRRVGVLRVAAKEVVRHGEAI